MAKSIHLPGTPSETFQTGQTGWSPFLPTIDDQDPLRDIVRKLSRYFIDIIEAPYTFEQLRTAAVGHILKPLIASLSERFQPSNAVIALLILKWRFISVDDDTGVNEARGYACEIVAWRILHQSSEQDLVDSLLYELPAADVPFDPTSDAEDDLYDGARHERPSMNNMVDERSSLLKGQRLSPRKFARLQQPELQHTERSGNSTPTSFDEDPTLAFVGLNALEIAAIANAKKFLSQPVVQKIVNGIWSGEIIFWESLSVHTKKKAQLYNTRRADPYSRLRVPKCQKVFEALFFVIFLGLYYAVLVERNPRHITAVEVLLYLWIAAFAYEEFGEFKDAGTLFYATDFWSLWDIGIIGIGVAYLVSRIIGLVKDRDHIIDISFDILSLEALFLVPRVCSLLSLLPYFGTLIPCLKEMTKDFVKFLGIVVILFFGFLTTFTMLARESQYTARNILVIMVKVFFGSSYLGFDVASEISPALGPPLMLCFVVLTNILLLTSLIAILSQSLNKVMDHAREEYLFQYSVFVLEASTSRRLTYYLPPLNLVPLVLFRPLRLCIPAENLRSARIILLKMTHLPHVAAIWAYEGAAQRLDRGSNSWQYTRRLHKGPGRTNSTHGISQYSALRNQSEASILPKTPVSGSRPSGINGKDSVVELEKVWCDGNIIYGRIKQAPKN